MSVTDDQPYWVAFSTINSIGPQKIKRLRVFFRTMRNAWEAPEHQLLAVGLSKKDALAITTGRTTINPKALWERTIASGITILTIDDPDYPAPLKEIYTPPALLFLRGKLPDSFQAAIAVVGTRKTTAYGRQITPTIVSDLSHAGVVIVSGLALGIDALAHGAALDAGGLTVAVLGSGLDTIYPASNRGLAEEIIKCGGALISEYPPAAPPLKQHFPARNRIISGLSRGVLVIEGAEDSGSLITARCALDQNREVFAVPGSIASPASRGPNQLIKLGAAVVTRSEDILEALNLQQAHIQNENRATIPVSGDEASVLGKLSGEPTHIDELIRACKLNTSTINSVLAVMEMKGQVRHLGGMYYVRTDRS